MQQMMQNKFVSPTTAGTMEWAKLGILISLVCFPQGHILLKLAFAVLCSLLELFICKINRDDKSEGSYICTFTWYYVGWHSV